MIGLVTNQRSNNGELVAHGCQLWKRFTDFHAGDIGRDRFPRTSELFGGFRLQVKHVLMRRSAHQVNHDDRFGILLFAGGFFGSQQGWQRPTSGRAHCGQRSNIQQAASRKSITEAARSIILRSETQHSAGSGKVGGN